MATYTKEGFIYVNAGCRGRDVGAPAGITDLKAAVRYIRYNEGNLPDKGNLPDGERPNKDVFPDDEIDGDFKTPAADNMVYQNFPAIVFGFPMMLLATLAPVKPILTLIIFIVFFAVMNIILFRSKIFKKKNK